MNLLLDTHALLWWLFDDARLTESCRAWIANPEHRILVSAASAWEISTKHRLGKLPDIGDVATQLPRYLRAARFTPLPISLEHALRAGALPGPHRDPFDRMIMAQALCEDARVVTIDPVFRDYGIPVVE